MPNSTAFYACGVRLVLLVLPAAGMPILAAAATESQGVPTPQTIRIVTRILAFQDKPPASGSPIAVTFNPADAASVNEAKIIAGLFNTAHAVGDGDHHAVLVSDDELGTTTRIAGVVAATGVRTAPLRTALERLHVPCLTLDRAQVEHGSCMVALRTVPTVRILVNEANAAAAGVRFATAFRMMVQEL
ncbi:hypothetical protein [Rhizosaccharibacter radicis]|uniref:YfiR family protein n=1 Tax=Rhizosaccharibacter radicis TaxID=2782605 RepID=A0ABT1VTK6_9PROT|nr:hypothetical protein [Acetobacteraceae bacterium KSS12]